MKPAEKLLDSIAKEKQRLHKEKKIRKPKKAVPITETVIPYELPSGWRWARLTSTVQRAVDCLHKTAPFENEETGFYCVDTTCMSEDGIEFENLRHVSKKTYIGWTRRMVPESGDVIFSREGTVGLTAIVPENMQLCLGQRVMIFRLPGQIAPSYFQKALISPAVVTRWKQKIMGTTASRVNISDILQFLLPIPPHSEQLANSREVERLLSVADDVSATVETELKRAERLRQSILKQAFSGKLVPPMSDEEAGRELSEKVRQVASNGSNAAEQCEMDL